MSKGQESQGSGRESRRDFQASGRSSLELGKEGAQPGQSEMQFLQPCSPASPAEEEACSSKQIFLQKQGTASSLYLCVLVKSRF